MGFGVPPQTHTPIYPAPDSLKPSILLGALMCIQVFGFLIKVVNIPSEPNTHYNQRQYFESLTTTCLKRPKNTDKTPSV